METLEQNFKIGKAEKPSPKTQQHIITTQHFIEK